MENNQKGIIMRIAMTSIRHYSTGCLSVFFLLFALSLSGCNGNGFQGIVYEKTRNSSFGQKIAGVKISFIKENSNAVYTATSDQNGAYKISLANGRYWVRAVHAGYEDYSSNPGFFVVTGSGYQTGNIFMRQPSVTTVILSRHAERANDSDTTSLLQPNGFDRARTLTAVLWRAGITRVFSTSTKRASQTRKPFSDSLKLDTAIYATPQQLKNTILAENPGDVVFVVGHSNTVPEIISAFGGGAIAQINNEFDNLFVLSIYPGGQTQVLNLQYGASTPPDIQRGNHPVKTLILVSGASSSAQNLLHKIRSSGVKKLYATAASSQLLQPLKDTLLLPITVFDPANVQSLVDQITTDTTKISLVEINKPVGEEIITKLNAYPYPVIYADETGNIIVITISSSGSAKVVHVRY